MSENLHPQDEPWDDLPLPDENEAWQKMALRLDKENRRRMLPFWFWRVGFPALLFLGLATAGYFWVHQKENNPTGRDSVPPISRQPEENRQLTLPEEPEATKGTMPRHSATNQQSGKNKTAADHLTIVISEKEEAPLNTTSQQKQPTSTINRRVKENQAMVSPLKKHPLKSSRFLHYKKG